MKHPSEYSTTPFMGYHVMVVNAGTVVKDDSTDEEITVDDNCAARKGTTIFCTKKTYDAMKAACN